jgi:prevent-host-death family protein
MQKTISATQARIHFGEIIRQARIAPVIVERGGKEEIVVLSKKTYDRLVTAGVQADMEKRFDELHARIRAELAGRTLPDAADIIRQGREERDDQLIDCLR